MLLTNTRRSWSLLICNVLTVIPNCEIFGASFPPFICRTLLKNDSNLSWLSFSLSTKSTPGWDNRNLAISGKQKQGIKERKHVHSHVVWIKWNQNLIHKHIKSLSIFLLILHLNNFLHMFQCRASQTFLDTTPTCLTLPFKVQVATPDRQFYHYRSCILQGDVLLLYIYFRSFMCTYIVYSFLSRLNWVQ